MGADEREGALVGCADGAVFACTVLLLRDGAEGLEVFLVQRHGRSAFMPNMWVFPGGRVDEADMVMGAALAAPAMNAATWPPDAVRALWVAGVRETLEESGIWLGAGDLGPEDGATVAAGAARLADRMAQAGATLDLAVLRPWARWVTPLGEGRRFDTAFVVARVGSQLGLHDAHETVASGWLRPSVVLEGGFSAYPLAPPTFWALTELARYGDVDEVMAASARRDLRPVMPMRAFDDGRVVMILPGDPEHAEARRPGLPTRLVLGMEQWEIVP